MKIFSFVWPCGCHFDLPYPLAVVAVADVWQAVLTCRRHMSWLGFFCSGDCVISFFYQPAFYFVHISLCFVS